MRKTDQGETFGRYLASCASELGFGVDRFRLLVSGEAEAVAARIELQFGKIHFPFLGTERSCSLPSDSRQYLDDAGWRQISRIAPCGRDDAAWFIAENWK